MSWPDLNQISDDIPTWELLQQSYENQGFCFQTRLNLSDFITTNFIHEVPTKAFACELATQLLQELENYISTLPKSVAFLATKTILKQTYNNLKEKYMSTSDGQLQLYKIVYTSLMQEKEIVSKHEAGEYKEIQKKMNVLTDNVSKLRNNLYEIQQGQQIKTTEDHELYQMQVSFGESEEIVLEQKKGKRANPFEGNKDVSAKKKKLETAERASASKNADLENKRVKLIEFFWITFEEYNQVQNDVLENHLTQWKMKQRIEGYGDENDLLSLQKLCEDLVDNIVSLMKISEQISWDPMEADMVQKQLITPFHNLVSSTFMVVKQPPQVLRTGSRFTSEVSLLIGNKIFQEFPSVIVSLMPGGEAAKLNFETFTAHVEDENKGNRCGTINNNSSAEMFEDKNKTQVKFQNLQIVKGSVKRSRSRECTEDMFSLIFRTKFTCYGLEFNLWTRSLPLVIVSHDDQRMKAEAIIAWDNAGYEPFDIHQDLPWNQVFDALSRKWTASCGKPLTAESSCYLACKLFQDESLNLNQIQNMTLNWTKFKKDKLPNSTYTFWEYFHSMMTLTAHQDMKSIWEMGYIIGFVKKSTAVEMLAQTEEGTFLIRFSDSTLGGVTIGLRSANQKIMWHKFKEELAMRKIVDIIFDLKHLKTLYPNIPKKCFEKFRPQINTNDDDYVKIEVRAMLPDQEETDLLDDILPSLLDGTDLIDALDDMMSQNGSSPCQQQMSSPEMIFTPQQGPSNME